MLVLFLASWLVLAQSATLAPEVIELGQPILQEEIIPADIPREILLQRPLDNDELGVFDVPLLVNGEPQTRLSSPLNPRGRRPSCNGAFGCTRDPPRYRLDEFPPAQPNISNIGNICNEGRRKLFFGPWNLPQTGFSHLSRQGDALNNMEAGVGQCCQLPDNEKLPCCQSVWEKVLTQYCKQEFSVKTRPHFCCKVPAGEARYGCFARLAPYPDYDQEIQQVNLGQITSDLLDSLCGQFTLLTKQRNIPALVQNITEPCCKLQGNERTQCAEDVKSQFIATLCNSQKKMWKDPKQCCSQLENAALNNCFNLNYLNNVTLASATQITRPTVPSV